MLLARFRYEFQMQYGSIGWSVGALLGYAQGAKDKRVIACIGDGSFQVKFHIWNKISALLDDGLILLSTWENSAGDSTGCINYDPMRAEQHNLPDKQWRVHH
jgi:TPP-dependent 2-oxoacid decarboxylase